MTARYFDGEIATKSATCRRCGGGHSTKECTKQFEDFARCLVCGEQGHLSIQCPNREASLSSRNNNNNSTHKRRRLEDQVTEEGAICVQCGELDHVNCTLHNLNTAEAAETCARCGLRGHTDLNCTKRRSSTTTSSRNSNSGDTYEFRDSYRGRQQQRQSFPPIRRGGLAATASGGYKSRNTHHQQRYTPPPVATHRGRGGRFAQQNYNARVYKD